MQTNIFSEVVQGRPGSRCIKQNTITVGSDNPGFFLQNTPSYYQPHILQSDKEVNFLPSFQIHPLYKTDEFKILLKNIWNLLLDLAFFFLLGIKRELVLSPPHTKDSQNKTRVQKQQTRVLTNLFSTSSHKRNKQKNTVHQTTIKKSYSSICHLLILSRR